MQTTNIVSTPEIIGNIGSCTSNAIDVLQSRNGLWTENWQTVTTNSCTGQITYGQEYWQMTGMGITIITFALVILFLITMKILAKI
jgi:hypothetical protein